MSEDGRFTSPYPLETAVLFLVFNRLDTTKQVFKAIRQAKPSQLYIAADGPRADHPGEDEKVQAVRDYVVSSIDWDCEVKTLFRDENLGCKRAISSAIDWFFSHVEEGIILEDDCIPDQSFFLFCQDLLEHYRDDERIMMISGDNFQFKREPTETSYYFSRYPHIWGWASWKRAWDLYDSEMTAWPEIRENGYLKGILPDKRAVKYWKSVFDSVYNGSIDTWDYQWVFSCWINCGLSIIPNQNLISNIGFGQSSTHTKEDSKFSNLPIGKMKFPLKHPKFVIWNVSADRFTERIWYSQSRCIKFMSGLKTIKSKYILRYIKF
ncbi:MAG TPA: hemolytic protein HlpA-like protein [Rikenellaceae bacterium]|nr:hemolytic protein HlpA-like protein [Rikenellaceae bacterium]